MTKPAVRDEILAPFSPRPPQFPRAGDVIVQALTRRRPTRLRRTGLARLPLRSRPAGVAGRPCASPSRRGGERGCAAGEGQRSAVTLARMAGALEPRRRARRF